MSKKRNTTDRGRVILKVKKKEIIFSTKRAEEMIIVDEEPKSASANRALWRLCQTLTPEEITVLITKRKNELKCKHSFSEMNKIKNEIKILEDSYRIIKRRK